MMRLRKKGYIAFVVILLAGFLIGDGWAKKSESAEGSPDFSRFVVVGDSLSAGVQNFSLNEDFQPNSYANLIARQAGANLPLPLIARPGVPQPLTLISPGPPPVLAQVSGIPCLSPDTGFFTCRREPFLQPYNISVPNLKINEVLDYRPDCAPDPFVGGIRLVDLYVELVLGFPGCLGGGPAGSEIETAEALKPTFAILWIGNNDTLWAVVNGVTTEITNPTVFKRNYEEIVRRLAKTNTRFVIGNLPDPTLTPFLTSAEDVTAIVGQPLSVIGPVLGIGPGDYVTLFAFDAIQAILSGAMLGPLPDSLVVSAAEVTVIRSANLLFNTIVSGAALRYNVPVVDIRGLMNEIYQYGIDIGGQRLTTRYLGGVFSLDGFHPTNTGYAITANEFIKTINKFYGTDIPRLDLEAIKATDPLVFPDTGSPPS